MSDSILADGVHTVVPTPFDREGGLDLPSFARLIEFLVGLDVQGLLVLGVMGEAPKLLPDERRAVIEASVRVANGRCPVIVGATHPSVMGTRALAAAAASAGAAAVLVAPPRLDRAAGDEAIVEYFAASAEGLDIEVVLQDHPASSGVPLSPSLIGRIAAATPQIRSIKLEDPPTPIKVPQVRAAAPDLKIFGGLGGVFFLEELERGADGTMTGFAFPERLIDVYRTHAAGDDGRAAELFFHDLPLIRFEFQEAIGLAIRKQTYVRRGVIESDHVRAPAPPVDEATSVELERLFARLALDPRAEPTSRHAA